MTKCTLKNKNSRALAVHVGTRRNSDVGTRRNSALNKIGTPTCSLLYDRILSATIVFASQLLLIAKITIFYNGQSKVQTPDEKA
jgi:hypothetical protein